MTLLELLRQELPKRGGWPEGVRKISTHAEGQVFFDGRLARGFTLPKASDAWNKYKHPCSYTNAVTREQYEATDWDGTNLPPVGMEIEYKFAKVNYRTDFSRGKVLAYGTHNVFMEHWASRNEFIQSLDKIEFRPLRTEAERAIDEMVRLSGVSIGAAKILYDAGYRKE